LWASEDDDTEGKDCTRLCNEEGEGLRSPSTPVPSPKVRPRISASGLFRLLLRCLQLVRILAPTLPMTLAVPTVSLSDPGDMVSPEDFTVKGDVGGLEKGEIFSKLGELMSSMLLLLLCGE